MSDAGAPAPRHLAVTRHGRWFALGGTGEVAEAWMALHGYGQLASYFARHFSAIASASRAIAVPEALNRFYLEGPDPADPHRPRRVGATWMTREDRETDIRDYVGWLEALRDEQRAVHGDVPLTVLGFSQGGTTACRWLARGTVRPARLILWAADVPADAFEGDGAEVFRTTPIDLVVGTRDEYVGEATLAAACARLDGHGVTYRVHRYDGTHRLDADVLRSLAATDR